MDTIAIIGGTGDLGSGLALRWAAAGHAVVIGSRDAARAEAFAEQVGQGARGASNLDAARAGDIVVIAVPWSSHADTLRELAPVLDGKIVVDAAVPLVPPRVSVVQLPPEGSAGQAAQALLGPGVRVVAAFQNVGAAKLKKPGPVDCDVLVCGDDADARALVARLADDAGARGIEAGPLANAAAADALTSLLIGVNRRYKADGAGIRITGLP